MSTTTRAPAGRYGSPRRGRRVVLLVAGGLALAFLGWLAWATWSYSRPQVTSELQGWTAAGPHEVTARFAVRRRDADVVATCTVRAYAADHTTVGERDVEVSGPATGPVTITVRTERPATAVEVVGCTAPHQSRPR